ncbi:MAG: TIM-barrel domain-containing protein [Promethearchaeota archaeon]
MRTRLLESKNIFRNTIKSIDFIKMKDNSLFFKTTINPQVYRTNMFSSWDPAESIEELKEHDKINATLCIDFLTDTILRIRYNEGDYVKENNTPMVVGSFKGPLKAELKKAKGNLIVLTNKLIINIALKPYSITIYDLNNIKICGISGPEKNRANRWDAINTGICYSKKDNIPIGVECFDLSPHESIYGFGEKFTRLNKVGQTVDLLMDGAWSTISPRSYKNVPFFMSTNNYGVFFNHSSPMTIWVGSMSAVNIQVAIEDDFLDYYVIFGDMKEILSQYTDITGKGVLPPKWTFGYWQSRFSYQSAEEVLNVAKSLRENEIPCDVICIDTHWFKIDWKCDLEFDKERFPNPKKFLKQLDKLGFKTSVWQLPYIPEGSLYFDDLKTVDGFVKNKAGEIYDTGLSMVEDFKGITACIDFTNPKAVEVYKKWIRKLFELGVNVIKSDFGEDAPLDSKYYDGTTGRQMHNLYPLLYNKAVAEITKEMTGGICAWSRSAWAGNQRYPVHWGGDTSVNWENMIPQLEGGLSFGLSGFQFWSQDIGGFFGITKGDLLIRWMQLGLFNSHSRIHGTGKREIYKFRKNTFNICRDYIQLRYRLLPYIYGSAIKCVEKSLPMTRALVIEFQDDPTVWNIGDEFLFGDSLLIAPITDKTNKRTIYLPEGIWTNWWTGERIKGGNWIYVEVDIETMPLYIREGGIIPMGPVMNYIDEIRTEEILLRIAKFEGEGKSNFIVPVNDEIVLVEYTASDNKHVITIGKTEINFKIKVVGEDDELFSVIKY